MVSVERFSFSQTLTDEGRFTWQVNAPRPQDSLCRLDTGDGRTEYTLSCAEGEQLHTYAEAGTYTATLTVRGQQGQDVTASRTVEILGTLGASFIITPQLGVAPLETTFDASDSRAPEATSFRWDFGDGATGAGTRVGHTYDAPGIYEVTLTLRHGEAQTEQVQTVEVLATATKPTELTWQRLADAPIDRHEAFGGFAADGKLYVFGGYNVSTAKPTFKPTRRVDAYDPQSNTWTQRRDLPVGLSHAGTAIAGNTVYFAGGYPEASNSLGQRFATDEVWAYDAAADSYTALPKLPAKYGGGALALVNGNLHFYGGSDAQRQDTADHWTLPLENIESGTWTRAADLPLPRNHLGSAVVGGKIYAVGGQSGQDAQATYHAQVSVYNPATDAWTEAANLPRALSHNNASTFALNGRIIVLGGEYAYLKSIDNAYAYDPQADTWEELTNLPVPKNAGVGGHHAGNLYHVTGSTSEDTFRGTFR